MPLTLRLEKGSELTYAELDGNFTYLSSSIVSGTYTLSGSFAAERIIISGNTSSAAPGGLATNNNLRTYNDNNGIAIGGSEGTNGVSGLGLVISETPSNGNHVILSDGSGSNLRLRAAGGDSGDCYVIILSDQAGNNESDVFTVAQFGGPLRGTELYHTGSLVFYTNMINGTGSVYISGSISGSGNVYLPKLPNTPTPNIVGFDITTGQLTYYSTASFGGGGGTPTDITALNNFTGSAQISINSLNSFTGSVATVNIVPLNNFTGSAQTSITALNSFSGSASTRIGNLEAATGSYVTNAKTGSFLYSGSYDGIAKVVTLYSKATNYNLDLSGLAGAGGGFPVTASDEGNDITNSMSKINFVGNAVSASAFGSVVTVTINTGSASTTDITALNNFTGSAQISLNALQAATGSYVYSGSFDGVNTLTLYRGASNLNLNLSALIDAGTDITALNNFTGSAQTSIDALNNFSGSASTRLDSLEAATGSYVTNARTGSFYYSSSISSNVITFNQGDGTTESITVVSVPSASFAPNLYNSDGTLTAAREVNLSTNALKFNNSSAFFTVSGSDRVTFNNLSEANYGYVAGYDLTGISGTQGLLGYVTASKLTVASASHAPNLYNSNGTLTGDRVITLGASNELRIQPSTGASEFRVSDGPKGGPFSYEFAVSSSGEIRVNSSTSASFATDIFITLGKVLTLQPTSVLPIGAPVGSFAVSSSVPPRPYMWDGTTWYAL